MDDISGFKETLERLKSQLNEAEEKLNPSPENFSNDDLTQQRNVLTSMNTDGWYTPRDYLYLVRKVLGVINLDPASSAAANRIVHAEQFYTVEDNGLEKDWFGNVFCNPPYVKPDGSRGSYAPKWAVKAIHEKTNGRLAIPQMILLFNAKVGYNWFNDIVNHPDTTVIIHEKRIAFINAKKLVEDQVETTVPSRQPQMTVYMGNDIDTFMAWFGPLGWRLV